MPAVQQEPPRGGQRSTVITGCWFDEKRFKSPTVHGTTHSRNQLSSNYEGINGVITNGKQTK